MYKLIVAPSVVNPDRTVVFPAYVESHLGRQRFDMAEKVKLDRARSLIESGKVSYICNALESEWLTIGGKLHQVRADDDLTQFLVVKILNMLHYYIPGSEYSTLSYGRLTRQYKAERDAVGSDETVMEEDRIGRIAWLTYLIDHC